MSVGLIEFECPQGHRLSCAASKAGSAATCPKCGQRFIVPGGEADAAAIADSSSASGVTLSNAGNGAATQATAEEMIVFLCPNGHTLNGPKSLQGHPGKCPHCGSKFRIPNYDEQEWAEQHHGREDTVVDDEMQATEAQQTVQGETLLEAIEVDGDEDEIVDGHLLDDFEPHPEQTPTVHPLAVLFQRLWREQVRGGSIELHLQDGSSVVPHRYAEAASRGPCGVFAVRDVEKSYTISAIAWSDVRRVVIRRVSKLPTDLFPPE